MRLRRNITLVLAIMGMCFMAIGMHAVHHHLHPKEFCSGCPEKSLPQIIPAGPATAHLHHSECQICTLLHTCKASFLTGDSDISSYEPPVASCILPPITMVSRAGEDAQPVRGPPVISL